MSLDNTKVRRDLRAEAAGYISHAVDRYEDAGVAGTAGIWLDMASWRLVADAVGGTEATPWRCFHCGETFWDADAARLHFGRDEGATPACQIRGAEGGLLLALRRAEQEAEEAWSAVHDESSAAVMAMRRQTSRHDMAVRSAEETGYERGVDDVRREYDAAWAAWWIARWSTGLLWVEQDGTWF